MSHFPHIDGELCAESVPLRRIAEEVGTPFYVYSTAALEERYHAYQRALGGMKARLYYSVKANSNLAVIATLAKLGAGAATEALLKTALSAG